MKYLLTLLALAGCTTAAQKPQIVEVDKPVAINCIKEKPARPFYKTEHLSAQASDLDYADALANDWIVSRVYEKSMEDAVNACLSK